MKEENVMNKCKKKRSGASIMILLFSIGVLGAGLLATVLSQPLNAQVLYGSVSGTVSDQSGAVVAGAKVSITNDATDLRRLATTDSTGTYRILDLPQGTYTIIVTASGFEAFKKTSVGVAI